MTNISNTENLWRRIFFKDPNYVKDDGSITSLAFRPRSADNNQLSVDREHLADYHTSLQDADRFRIGALSAAVPLDDLGMNVVSDPLPDNDAHALICGDFSKAQCRKLAASAVIIAHQKR